MDGCIVLTEAGGAVGYNPLFIQNKGGISPSKYATGPPPLKFEIVCFCP